MHRANRTIVRSAAAAICATIFLAGFSAAGESGAASESERSARAADANVIGTWDVVVTQTDGATPPTFNTGFTFAANGVVTGCTPTQCCFFKPSIVGTSIRHARSLARGTCSVFV